MSTHRTMGRSFRELVENDLDIMPLMNLFVALIPMLLISAVFLKVTVIDMDAPTAANEAQNERTEEPLLLSVTIRPDVFVIQGHGLSRTEIDRRGDDPSTDLADALATVVAAHPRNRDVTIVSAATTRYDDIITVMDITRAAGLPSAALLGAK